MPEWYRQQIEANRPQLYARAREEYGVELNQGPSGIDSRPALIATKYAESQGKGNEFQDAVLKGYWQEARNIEDVEVLTELAESVGLAAEMFRAALDDPQYEEQVDYDIALAQSYDLRGVPALVLAEKYLIPGAVPYQTLRQAVAQIRDERRNENQDAQ